MIYEKLHRFVANIVRKLPGPFYWWMVKIAPKIVQCQICKERFQSVFICHEPEDYNQGHDCATCIYKARDGKYKDQWLLVGGYGSSHYDMDAFVLDYYFAGSLDPVCDKCVEKVLTTYKHKQLDYRKYFMEPFFEGLEGIK